MKFGVTSKSGHSVIIDAPNYKAAQKEAERRFGKGVIVQLVGNACTNPIVENALKAKNSRLNIRVGSQVTDESWGGNICTVTKIEGDTIIAKRNLDGKIVRLKNDDEHTGIFANALTVAQNDAYANYPMLKNFKNTIKTEMSMLVGNITSAIKAIKEDYAAELRGSANEDEKNTMNDCLDKTVAELEGIKSKVVARKTNPMA